MAAVRTRLRGGDGAVRARRSPGLAAGLAVLIGVAVLFALFVAHRAARAPDQSVLRGTTERHIVQVTLEPPRTGRVRATVDLTDRDGRPATPGEVVLEAAMPRMGHLSSELPTTREKPGRFRAVGELFPMVGVWELTVRIDGGELATVSVTVIR